MDFITKLTIDLAEREKNLNINPRIVIQKSFKTTDQRIFNSGIAANKHQRYLDRKETSC